MKVWYRFLILIAIVINVQNVFPQWTQTNGPGSGPVTSLAVKGNNIFAGSNGSVYLTTNNGTTWTLSGLHYESFYTIYSLAANENNIYAGVAETVYRSSDNGTNWTQEVKGLTNTHANTFAFRNTDVLAGTNAGVFLSTNGTDWAPLGLQSFSVLSLVVTDNNIFAGTSGGGVYFSTDYGSTWNAVNNGLNNTTVNALAGSGNNIFAGTSGGVYLSIDNGTTWTSKNNYNVSSLIFHGTSILAGTMGGVYLSTNNGTNWTIVNNGLTYQSVNALASSGDNIFAGVYYGGPGHVGGVFLSIDDGTSWTEVGLPNNFMVLSLAVNGTKIFAGSFNPFEFRLLTFSEGPVGGIYYSNDVGTNWTQVSPSLYSFNVMAVSGNNIYAGASVGPFGGAVLLSTNNENSWTKIFSGNSVFALAISGTNIFVGTRNGIYLSSDNGTNWTQENHGLTNTYINSLTIYEDKIFACTNGGVFLSTNNGTDWVQSGLSGTWISSLTVSGSNIVAGTGTGVYYTTNDGTDWQRASGSPLLQINALVVEGNNLFACTTSGVFLSSDNGVSWIPAGLSGISVSSLAFNETDIYAGGFTTGVWKRPLSDILPVELTSFTAIAWKGSVLLKWNTATELNNSGFDVERSSNKTDWGKVGFVKGNGNSTMAISYSYVDKSTSKAGKYYYRLKQVDNNGSFQYSNVAEVEFGAPSSYALNQNYPNPFNPSTKISYLLKDKGFVKLKVYGIKGELIKELVNELKDAGYYESEFDGKGLASGVYIYRLEVIGDGNKLVYSDIKKTVLLK
jgi:photosystem II stability/assembly factor-like uncharacterized protein